MNTLHRLYGRIAIVTASTQGIGFAAAQRLAQEGAKIIICSRKEKNVQEATEKLRSEGFDVKGLICHVSNADDRKKLFDEAQSLGGLDILVSNAAVNPALMDVLECPEGAWDKIFDVNVKASFLLAKEALPLLRQSKAGRIMFVSSIAAYRQIHPLGAYSVSKAALLGLTKAAALQVAPDNITVNCIVPGIVQTNFANVLLADENDRKEQLSQVALHRFGKPHDISGLIAFLASDDGAYITGENIVVAGGMATRL